MAQASKTFRIFVSSTFSDLKEERNALQQQVFPKLRALCMQLGCRFQAIDLRWGVREEAALDQQTMKICLEEIARCQRVTPRPNFIVLLGDRYGWRPLPAEIPADEFEEILRCLPADETEKQRRHALLTRWYRRDDNAVPPVYCLLPREGAFKDFNKWEVVERELRSILLEAIEGTSLAPEQRLKYLASATEQEIAKAVLRVPDAREHVFCFFRNITNLPLDQSAKDFVDLLEVDGAYQPDTKARDRLERLKNRELRGRLSRLRVRSRWLQLFTLKNRELRERLPGNIYDYEAEWTSSGITTGHIAKLCEDVYQSLSRIITEEIARIEKVDPLEQEQAAHENFGKERAKFFVGRADMLQTIGDYVKGGNRHPLVVHGASGVGKSALMARAVEQARKDHLGAEIIVRFIGATPGSSDGQALLESLCRQLSRRYGEDESTVPKDPKELVQEFPKRLALATAGKPLIVFLDALDQLANTDNTRTLTWLPAELPEHVHVVVSTLHGECFSALEKKRPVPNFVELEPMPLHEGSNLLKLWLEDASRTLQDHQREEVLGQFSRNGLPLYLKLAFEEARRWKSYTDPRETVLSGDIPGIIRHNLFARLSSDANHGQTMVSQSLGYLAAAKNGLSEDELLDILSRSYTVFKDFLRRARHRPPERRLPVVVWSRLYFDLEPYLTERSADGASLLAFYHRQLGEAVTEDYLAGKAKRERHRGLAQYFAEQALHIEKNGTKTPNVRKVSELPYQQTQGLMWNELEQTLTDLSFVETKCATASVYDVLRDYLDALDDMPQHYRGYETISSLHRAIDRNSYVLRDDPSILVQQVYNDLVWDWDETNLLGRTVRNAARHYQRTWLKWRKRPAATADRTLLRTLTEHRAWVRTVAFLSDCRTVASFDGEVKLWNAQTGMLLLTLAGQGDYHMGAVAFSPDGKTAMSWCTDGKLRLWDTQTGMLLQMLTRQRTDILPPVFSPDGNTAADCNFKDVILWDIWTGAVLQTLTAHSGSVNSVAFSLDGKTIASWSNKEVKLWDFETGEVKQTLTENDLVHSLAFSPDSRMVAIGSSEKTVRVWDTQSGVLLRTLVGHSSSVNSVSFSPDGKMMASGSDDNTVKLWDTQTGLLLRTLTGHGDEVFSVAFSPDGKVLASGSRDRTVKLWDTQAEVRAQTRTGHHSSVNAAAFSPDGKMLASGSLDNTVKLWDSETDTVVRTLRDSIWVNSVAFSPDGKILASGATDGTVKLWDGQTWVLLRRLTGHSFGVEAIAFSPDGKMLASGSIDWEVKLWDAQTGMLLRSLVGHHKYVNSVAFSPDGRTIASGSTDRTVRLWDVQTGNLKLMLKENDAVYSVAFSPDGGTVASGSGQYRISAKLNLWAARTGELLGTLREHSGLLHSIIFSPDGKCLASGSGEHGESGEVKLWDTETRTLITWMPCVHEVLALWFSSDSCELRVADAGRATHAPNVYVLEIVGPQR